MTAQMKERTQLNTALRRILKVSAAAGALIIAGCGGGGGSTSAVNAVVPQTPAHAAAADAFSYSGDEYGMQNATYLAASTSQGITTLRAAIASSMTDPNFRTVARIEIDRGSVTGPGAYALDTAAAGTPAFPGKVYFFDGHQSTMLQTVGGSITFTSFGTNPGDTIAGSFSAIVQDGGDSTKPSYHIAADFAFTAESSGALTPAVSPVPSGATAAYDTNCASCHTLGTFDQSGSGAPDLALKGGKLDTLFTPDVASHHGLKLASAEIGALKVLLNAN